LKLFKDIADTIEKYRQEYETLNHKFWCITKANDSAVSDIPKKDQREIGDVINQVFLKISSLKDCKEQLQCLDMSSSGTCEDSNYEPVEEKPDLPLGCKDGNIEALKTLKQAVDELAKSKKHHDLKEKSFNEYKGTLAGIQEKFKKIDDYQQKADKACKDGQKCMQYVYTLMIKRVLDEMQLYSPDELGTELKNALDGLKAAKTDRCIKEYVKAKIEATISLLQQSFEEKEKSRDEDILSKIKSTSM
jgi:superfamily I DNA/RNA helicase